MNVHVGTSTRSLIATITTNGMVTNPISDHGRIQIATKKPLVCTPKPAVGTRTGARLVGTIGAVAVVVVNGGWRKGFGAAEELIGGEAGLEAWFHP
jgi:hypothetical protein